MPTLAEVAREVQQRLQAVKDVAPREGRELVLHAMELEDNPSIILYHSDFDTSKTDILEQFVVRRMAGEPLQYILGHAWFYGRTFTVTPAVLIPRPDTETLVEACLQRLNDTPARVLELGVGSGCIGATLLAERPAVTYVGVEIDAAAAEVARRNIGTYAEANRWEVKVQDGLDGVTDGPFDMLVSNPPYVTDEEWTALEADVRDHEPRLALTGATANPDGMLFYRKLAAWGARTLRTGGWLCVETGWQQTAAVQDLLQEYKTENGTAAWHTISIINDLAGRGRVVCAQRAG
ncbi:MAG: peptide chain release factor N(5)-glutamine methyltransferase [Blastochloris viridis]|uniref:Release factor glutamine methyltransferase n=1 Tax=Blastochloris viridis TaxID=1079 RepID=A0A6N4REP7_BLAVI|nr:MAG: peptide chain release factor N(5)-glutamine methyltransferase [Blastochloris viridis]